VLTGRVSLDPSEVSRTFSVTEVSQRRWFHLVDDVRVELARMSPGTYTMPDGSTVGYEDVRAHFVIGSDEENVMLSTNGKKIVGKRGKKHHMNHSQNSRKSATAMRTGSAAGYKGPSIYIVGMHLKYVTQKYLEEHGAPFGSIMTHNSASYMTHETWDEHVEAFCKGMLRDKFCVWACLYFCVLYTHTHTQKVCGISVKW
jgi:hypothetical protein